jgi:hypothetical protein
MVMKLDKSIIIALGLVVMHGAGVSYSLAKRSSKKYYIREGSRWEDIRIFL